MSYASDKLYNGYLRTNMPRIVTKVKPTQIIPYLPCLTDHDREAIEAKNDFSGKFEAMKVLLDCMRRRENWPEQFIAALEECEHTTIAAEIKAEYDKLRGINNSSPPPPASPAANVVMAHVHPAPSGPHLPDPGPAASALPAQDVPTQARETNPIQETETPAQSTPVQPAAPAVQITTPSEPPQVQAATPPVTPPPSPESARISTNPSPPPEQVNFIPQQEPEENLEPEIVQTVNIPGEADADVEVPLTAQPEESCETDDILETKTTVHQSVPVPAEENENTPRMDIVNKPIVVEPEPDLDVKDDHMKGMTTVEEDSLTTTIVDSATAPPVAAEVLLPRSVSPLTNLDDLILTPEKAPVQETSPKEETIPMMVPVLEETPKHPNTQVVESVQEPEVTPSPPAEVENGEDDQGSVSEEDDILLSKPGVLLSVEPSDQNNSTMCPPSLESTPYSGDSGRLEMSEECAPSCQKNRVSLKQQDKEVSESPTSNLKEADVEENVGHVAEEPSILNKELQPLQEDSAEPTKAMTTISTFVPENTLISSLPSCTNTGHTSEPPASSLDVEDVEENLIHVVQPPSILNQENQTALTEDTEEQAIEVATTMVSNTCSCPDEEEGISESPAPSLDMEDVRENVGHVAEEPSILNLEVQTPLQQVNGEPANEALSVSVIPDIPSMTNVEHAADIQSPIIQVNGEPTKEMAPVLPKSAPATNENHQLNNPLVDQKRDSGNRTTSRLNTRYIMTAAGVGACALLIAWKFKH